MDGLSPRRLDAFADTLAIGASTAPEHKIALAVRQFQRIMDVPGCAVTSVHPRSGAHEVVLADGYPAEAVARIEGLVTSRLYRARAEAPPDAVPLDAVPLWRDSPEFVATATVTEVLRPAGFRDGTSVPLRGPDRREVGALHLNLFTEGLSGTQLASLGGLRAFVGGALDLWRRRESFGLSPREVEILRLVVAGASNPEIAEELYIARRTVATHVEHLLSKLGVTSRVAAAVSAVRHGLVGETPG